MGCCVRQPSLATPCVCGKEERSCAAALWIAAGRGQGFLKVRVGGH